MRYRGQFGHLDEFWPGRRFLVILETPGQLHQGFYLHQDFPCIKVRPLGLAPLENLRGTVMCYVEHQSFGVVYDPFIRGPVMFWRRAAIVYGAASSSRGRN